MKARVAIQIGVHPSEWRILKKAAKARRLPLATYVRWAALQYATYIGSGDVDFTADTAKVGVSNG